MPDARTCCGAPPRSPRPADAAGRAARAARRRRCRDAPPSGRPPAADPAAPSHQTRRPPSSSSENAPTSARATTARSFGSPVSGPVGGGGQRIRSRIPPSATTSPARGTTARARSAATARGNARWTRERPPRTPVDHEPRRECAQHGRRGALVVRLRVRQQQRVQPLHVRLPQPGHDRPVGRPGVHEHRRPVALQQRRVALPDVEERHDELAARDCGAGHRRRRPRPPRRRPPRRARRRTPRPAAARSKPRSRAAHLASGAARRRHAATARARSRGSSARPRSPPEPPPRRRPRAATPGIAASGSPAVV